MKRRKFIRNTTGLAVGTFALSSFQSQLNEIENKVPKSLLKGDLIGITAPAGCIWNKWHVEKIEKRMAELGFRTKIGKTIYEQAGYLAGSDQMRADELMEFYQDKSIRAILTMRGGWGCSRILDLLDYDIIKNNPKVLIGFSDITSLVNAVYKKTGIITFHGPCGYSSWKEFTTNNVLKAIVGGQPFTMKNPADYQEGLLTLSPGKAQGRLVGGNLTVVMSMIGTEYEPEWQNNIFFLEEIGEEPYRIDRMLWQLKQHKVFDKVNGVVIGSLHKCQPEEPEKSFSLQEIIDQHFKDASFPVYQGATFGHLQPKFTLPIGVMAELDADKCTIRTLEKSVFN